MFDSQVYTAASTTLLTVSAQNHRCKQNSASLTEKHAKYERIPKHGLDSGTNHVCARKPLELKCQGDRIFFRIYITKKNSDTLTEYIYTLYIRLCKKIVTIMI